MDSGADILQVETIFDMANSKAALFAIENLFEKEYSRIPVMVGSMMTFCLSKNLLILIFLNIFNRFLGRSLTKAEELYLDKLERLSSSAFHIRIHYGKEMTYEMK